MCLDAAEVVADAEGVCDVGGEAGDAPRADRGIIPGFESAGGFEGAVGSLAEYWDGLLPVGVGEVFGSGVLGRCSGVLDGEAGSARRVGGLRASGLESAVGAEAEIWHVLLRAGVIELFGSGVLAGCGR